MDYKSATSGLLKIISIKNNIMIVKDIWTDMDFEQMGWHDNYIHAIVFPNENQKLVLDMDYIFKWVLDEKSNLYKFWVSPCNLMFMDVLNLKIDLDFQKTVGLAIQDINRSKSVLFHYNYMKLKIQNVNKI
ncbi:hypothetical protein AS358_13885 [Elizabethkingia anophelis]|uniref:hypothetical protein n=3 Tax=Weeksellaceae TaxID=2762318 RepID=UPI000739936A|nr:hypothetical protein AS358_13885 [Elizabethkingia anophelis]MCT3864778.1 hypothetical protein [Elizabethkingia anophelis]MCT4217345.1 hypothetical protein [Elizabethkingia anophelis]MDV3561033.1 hypothetical protein [Elizabethkingia anophelis]MDV3719336.1 hypothetical protein [Elizabethkingia anophelis]